MRHDIRARLINRIENEPSCESRVLSSQVKLVGTYRMNRSENLYKGYRFPPEIIQYAVWLYHRFNFSHRDIEDILAEGGIVVSYESIRCGCNKFGPNYAKRLRREHSGYGDSLFIDEVFVKTQGKLHYLGRDVDQDGEVVDVFLQTRRDGAVAKRYFKRLLKTHPGVMRKVVTDKLRSYHVAHREPRVS